MKKLFYYIVKTLCTIGLPFYFSRFEKSGLENIPSSGPVLFTPNHHNAFLDAVIVGVISQRPIHYLTRSDVFVRPYLWMLDALNMMPVYRRRDGYEKLAANEVIFEKCKSILKEGGCVLVFPEANQADTHYLRPLTKGASRLAFQAQEVAVDDVLVVPVGLNYFNMKQPRRKMIVRFGKPVNVRDFIPLYQSQGAKGLIALRDAIAEGIRSCLVLPIKDEHYKTRKKVFEPANEQFSFDELRQRAITMNAVETRYSRGLKTWSDVLHIANWLPLLIIRSVIRKKVKDPQFIGPLKFALGLVLFPLWWILVFTILYFTTNITNAVLSTIGIVISLFVGQYLKNLAVPPS